MSKITKPINICYCDACGRVCEQKERKYEVCLREPNSPQIEWTKQDLCDECYSRLIQYVGFEDQEVI